MNALMNRSFDKSLFICLLIVCAAMSLMGLNEVIASTTDSSGLPWADGLNSLRQSIKGPFATTLAIVGIVSSGGMLIFGAEISGVMKSMMMLVLVVCIIVLSEKLITAFGGDASVINELTSDQVESLMKLQPGAL